MRGTSEWGEAGDLIEACRGFLAWLAGEEQPTHAPRTDDSSDEDDSWMFEDVRWPSWESDEDEKAAA